MKSASASLSLASSTPRACPTPVSMDNLIAATSQIVSAYLVNRAEQAVNLNALTADVFATLRGLAEQGMTEASSQSARASRRNPSVSVEESVKADYIVCLEDGKRVKMLKRYLKTTYQMTPEEYRARWDLPANYPMVAPNYAVVRSNLAKKIGLGRRGMPTVAKRLNAANVAGMR